LCSPVTQVIQFPTSEPLRKYMEVIESVANKQTNKQTDRQWITSIKK